MKDPSIIDLVKDRARETYKIYGYVNAFIIGRKLAISSEIIKGHLWKLGFVEDELIPGRFIRKEDKI